MEAEESSDASAQLSAWVAVDDEEAFRSNPKFKFRGVRRIYAYKTGTRSAVSTTLFFPFWFQVAVFDSSPSGRLLAFDGCGRDMCNGGRSLKGREWMMDAVRFGIRKLDTNRRH